MARIAPDQGVREAVKLTLRACISVVEVVNDKSIFFRLVSVSALSPLSTNNSHDNIENGKGFDGVRPTNPTCLRLAL